MEQQIQKKVVEFTKRNQDRMAEETGIQSSLTDEKGRGRQNNVHEDAQRLLQIC